MENILFDYDRKSFRKWLEDNFSSAKECWVANLQRGEPKDCGKFYYLDAVEEALCFGWIDSVFKKVDGTLFQKFSPRKKNSHWTVLNIARVKRLISLGLMTTSGLEKVPKNEYIPPVFIINDLKKAGIYEVFSKMPTLYQQIRISLLESKKRVSEELYRKSLSKLIAFTKAGQYIGQWDDYGRLR